MKTLWHTMTCLSFTLACAAISSAADAPLPAAQAPSHMTLPEGFRATLFAGEPDVVQPIAFTFDDRGRLWVVENLSYPKWLAPETTEGHDRIVIFDDPDATGHFKSRKVFYDKGVNYSGIEVGFGGVWLCASPNLIFIPWGADQDTPAGPPQVMLDGWATRDAKHNVFNHLTWGPDGWLWGCNGILGTSKVGKPSTPDAERTPMNCGVWRYHPTRQVFEVVASGTTNPWGLDFDLNGQPFITNCVISHLWHVIPGAHYERMFGNDLSPDAYALMGPCADHLHWAGGAWTSSRGGLGAHSLAGGGHAHVGAMVYLGDNWPDSYRDSIFMCNLHGNRVNNDTLEPKGSGYVGHHGKDFMLANDPWFRGIDIKYGPDGGVFVSDWTDTGECHNWDQCDQSNGRIYKISYGSAASRSDLPALNLAALSDAELLKLLVHKNAWFARHAQRLLQERAGKGSLAGDVEPALRAVLKDDVDVHHKLQALWTLHAIGKADEHTLLTATDPAQPWLCWWAVQLAVENRDPSRAVLDRLLRISTGDASPVVRLAISSALQRIAPGERWAIAEALCRHVEDRSDANLPLMDWYAIAPAVASNPDRALALIRSAQIDPVREFSAHRLAADHLPVLVDLLGQLDAPQSQIDVLHGILYANADRQHIDMPAQWKQVYDRLSASADVAVRDNATTLALLFGDERAVTTLRAVLADPHREAAGRIDALHRLEQINDAQLPSILISLLKDSAIRGEALQAMGAFVNDATAGAVLDAYPTLADAEKSASVVALAARPSTATALLDAIDAQRVEKAQVSTFVVRQLASLNDPKITSRVEKIFGVVHASAKDKLERIAAYKKKFNPDNLKSADRPQGRVLFSRSCGMCHTLFDAGGTLAPNLTGSQRSNIDYLLGKVLDPNASVPRDYQMTVVKKKDGQVINGIIASDTPQALTLKTPTGPVVIQSADIERRKTQPISMMPEGLLDGLTDNQTRDLLGYLMGSEQVGMPKQ